MFLIVVAIFAGLAVGVGRGGRLLDLARVRLSACWLPPAAFALQLAAGFAPFGPPPPLRSVALLVSYAGLGGWLLLNLRDQPVGMRRGLGLVALGWALNAAAILPNAGMPVSQAALRELGAPPGTGMETQFLWKHVPASSATPVRWLGDVLPVRPLRSVISVGDIALALGMAAAVAAGTLTPAATRP